MDQDRLKQVIDGLSQISDLLYQENVEPAYGLLVITLPEFEKIVSEISSDDVKAELKDKLTEALQAMEQGDYILLADILQYEIKERLSEYIIE